jgi:hypothetical protein
MISQHVTRCQKHRSIAPERRTVTPHTPCSQNAARQQAEAAFLPQADYGGRACLTVAAVVGDGGHASPLVRLSAAWQGQHRIAATTEAPGGRSSWREDQRL